VVVALALPASAQATFPGTNGRIAFERGGDIWTMNPDGSDQSNLTDPFALNEDPVWSPDGSQLAFTSPNPPETGAPQLWVMNADGSDRTHLGNNVTPDREPAWSPDGTQIAFLITGNYFVTPADGSSRTQLADEIGGGFSVDWSPDGKALAYSHSCDPSTGSAYIGIMAPTPNGTRTPVTSPTTCEGEPRAFPFFDYAPSWSPDGGRILFTREPAATGGRPDLYTIKPDGTDLQLLKSNAFHGIWSPDGSKIAFVTSSPSPSACNPCIKVMNADGTGEAEIAQGTSPDWQPIPVNAYVRPRGATPFRVSFVPAYNRCTSPNTSHGAPLASGSCAPPALTSGLLTTGTPESNGLPVRMDASLILRVVVGNSSTPADEADVRIEARINDVMNKDLTDYTGSLRANLPVRITDRDNTPHPGGPGPGTTFPFLYGFNFACTPDPDPRFGSECAISTTADTLVPGTIKESLRTIWQVGRVRVDDAGPDGDPNTPADNTVFAVQGVFVP
jgi:TolB protein